METATTTLLMYAQSGFSFGFFTGFAFFIPYLLINIVKGIAYKYNFNTYE